MMRVSPRRRGAIRARHTRAHALVRVAVIALMLGLLLDLFDLRGLAIASFRSSAFDAFRITSPVEAAVLGDGNLVLIEGVAADDSDGQVDRIEIAFDEGDTWLPVHPQDDDRTKWSYLWADPPPGPHRIRARAYGVGSQEVVEQSVTIQVRDAWDTTYVIANPYATAGTYRKGQLHVHSTNSFDGWESLPPGNLALEYKRRGYQFIAITDHDVISHATEIEDRDFITIPAYESTADSGHITGLFVNEAVSPSLPPQQRLDAIADAGGMAVLNHPSYRIGWTGNDFKALHGYFAAEIFNGITSGGSSTERNLMLWHGVLNSKGWVNRIWAVAVDDAHSTQAIDRGWVMVKSAQLDAASIRRALETGAFYASNGPSFSALGVLDGAITAASPEAARIRFIDQDQNVLKTGRGVGTSYKPTGNERWIRVEAVTADGHTAWSQPFWLLPNAPKATLSDQTLTGQTMPGARIHVSDRGQYLGNTVADDQGTFTFASRAIEAGPHELWIIATTRWADQINSPATLMTSP